MHFQRSAVRRTVAALAVVSGLALLTPTTATAAGQPPKPRRLTYAYVTSLDGHVYVIDTRTNSVLGIATTTVGGGADQVAVTPDGASLYVTNAFKYVSVVNIAKTSATNIPFDNSELSPDILYGEAIAPDGKHAYVAVQNPFHGDKVSVIDTATKQVSATIQVSKPHQVVISPNGKRLYVSGDKGGSLSVINTTNDQVIATIHLDEPANGMAITPDGKHLYVTGNSGTVSVISLAKRKIVHTIPGAGTGGVTISPNGSRAYVVGVRVKNKSTQGKVSVINTTTDAVTKTIPIGDSTPANGPGRYFLPSEVAVTPDGKSAYVVGSYGHGTPQGTVFAINTATEAVTPITVGAGDTMGAATGRL
ncbi:YncE family protein [Kitasatospora sp. NBC_01287]|uniref:YncE family protein n=1 Tax=Kitasatospora sp. NBC_01287 TaxID=2903573 RepID=UPI00224FAA0B|nr:YncE family protein [Kitasatospora sp. NBC_01287]MCX4751229.1 YncE family protein [Kitasatospora sp. NBC_01287]